MDLPPSFDKRVRSKVCKLKKSLYHLKQFPRAWFERLACFMKKISFCQGQTNHTLFLKYSPRGKVTILIVSVDDIILMGDNMVEMNHLKKCLTTKFEIKKSLSFEIFSWNGEQRELLFHNENIFLIS